MHLTHRAMNVAPFCHQKSLYSYYNQIKFLHFSEIMVPSTGNRKWLLLQKDNLTQTSLALGVIFHTIDINIGHLC